MKVNDKYLSIPPYLSVRWCDVEFLKSGENQLHIQLKSGDAIAIPDLDAADIEKIFLHHAEYLEVESQNPPIAMPPMGFNPLMGLPNFDPMGLSQLTLGGASISEMPIAFKIGTPDGVISALGHNPALAKSPPLPSDLLDKFAGVSQALGSEMDALPKGVDDCQCFFCQIMNRLHQEYEISKEDEIVTAEDLTFQGWIIQQTGDKLFSVENPLDSADKHSVYLGLPIGCSCGHEGCEHIIAVLKS